MAVTNLRTLKSNFLNTIDWPAAYAVVDEELITLMLGILQEHSSIFSAESWPTYQAISFADIVYSLNCHLEFISAFMSRK